MKKLIAIIIGILFVFCCACAEDIPSNEPLPVLEYFDVRVTLPADWHEIPLTEKQLTAGEVVCYGNGELTLTLSCTERSREHADIQAYADTITFPGAFTAQFGNNDFVLYNDVENSLAVCTVMATDSLMYTFTFSSITGDEDAAMTILGIMNTFEIITPAEES